VLVRPGASVRRGDVIATLDCREAHASSQAVAQQARALAARQVALAREATRMNGLLDGGFVAPNEVEQHQAESESEQDRLLAARAQMVGSSLAVNDCVMRAPFDGEVGDRMVDPGAFIRPGGSIVSLVDRSTVRVTADVPETDFGAVATGTPVRMRIFATGQQALGTIARRSPSADASTRTVHIEIDLPNRDRSLPVNTTAEISIDVGTAVAASEIPLTAANVRGSRANVFVIENGIAHARTISVLGESSGSLYVGLQLAPGAQVVTEGRALLADGDRVAAQFEAAAAPAAARDSGATANAQEHGR
jgi:RND family efflux transporter MFP subunit